jgi:2-polyprenyl-3-methyl-5-hydroxy-6-metoxy-1,4-benzoquinol methylase
MDILKKINELELVIAFQAKEIADLKYMIANCESQLALILNKSQQLIKATEGKTSLEAAKTEMIEKVALLQQKIAEVTPAPVQESAPIQEITTKVVPVQETALQQKIAEVTPAPVQETAPIQEITTKVVPVQEVAKVESSSPANTPEFQSLKNLLQSNEWPTAVDPSLICDISSEQDKNDRAEGILDLIIDVHLEGLSFLDFGCGEGHVVNKAKSQKPKFIVGYDIQEFEKWKSWPSQENVFFTTDWAVIEQHAPYNVVLLYDVLDHVVGDEIFVIDTLKRIKKNLAPNGKIYDRTHPWCSRHATHLYHQINKAYIHLIFREEELKLMGYTTGIGTRKIIHPLLSYNNWFKAAGLNIIYGPQSLKENIETFFKTNPLCLKRIREVYSQSHDEGIKSGKIFPTIAMEQQFVDYILT